MSNLVGKPVYFVHGDADSTVPVKFSRRSDEQLKELKNKSHVYVEVPGGDHSLFVREGPENLSKVFGFFNVVEKGVRSARR